MRTVAFLGALFPYRVPATTRDVLDLRLWVASLEGVEMLEAAADWAARHIPGAVAGELLEAVTAQEDSGQAVLELLSMCDTIASSAELPAELLDELAHLLDVQNEIPPGWTPKGICDCPRCRRGIAILPPGSSCIYDEHEAALPLARWTGLSVGEAAEPYYLTQLREVRERAASRMLAHSREQREETQRYRSLMKNKLGRG